MKDVVLRGYSVKFDMKDSFQDFLSYIIPQKVAKVNKGQRFLRKEFETKKNGFAR